MLGCACTESQHTVMVLQKAMVKGDEELKWKHCTINCTDGTSSIFNKRSIRSSRVHNYMHPVIYEHEGSH